MYVIEIIAAKRICSSSTYKIVFMFENRKLKGSSDTPMTVHGKCAETKVSMKNFCVSRIFYEAENDIQSFSV